MTISGQDRLAAGLRFDDDAGAAVAVHDRRDEAPVQHAVDAGFLDQRVGDQLEAFRIELVAQRLALGHGGAHRLGALLELAADAVGLDRRLVAVPGKPLDADDGDVAAEAAEALDQRHLDPGARRGQRRGQPARPGADDQHLGAADDGDLAGRLGDEIKAHRSPGGRVSAVGGGSHQAVAARRNCGSFGMKAVVRPAGQASGKS